MKDVIETTGEMWICYIIPLFNIKFESNNGTGITQKDIPVLTENAEGFANCSPTLQRNMSGREAGRTGNWGIWVPPLFSQLFCSFEFFKIKKLEGIKAILKFQTTWLTVSIQSLGKIRWCSVVSSRRIPDFICSFVLFQIYHWSLERLISF